MSIEFIFDSRLGIECPKQHVSWNELDQGTKEHTLLYWEAIRGSIPDRVKQLECQIEVVHKNLTEEEDFERSCELNLEMAELASIINDLWIWFRLTPSLKG